MTIKIDESINRQKKFIIQDRDPVIKLIVMIMTIMKN